MGDVPQHILGKESILVKSETESAFESFFMSLNEREHMKPIQKHINAIQIFFTFILQSPVLPFKHFLKQNPAEYRSHASERDKQVCAHTHPQGGTEEMGLLSTSSCKYSPAWKQEEGPSPAQGRSWPGFLRLFW